MSNFVGFLKGRENFVFFMKAKQQNEEWNFYLKAAIKRYEAADKLCTVTTKTKRFYLMKSKIFKGRLKNSCTWDTSVGFFKFSHPGKIDILYEISQNFAVFSAC